MASGDLSGNGDERPYLEEAADLNENGATIGDPNTDAGKTHDVNSESDSKSSPEEPPERSYDAVHHAGPDPTMADASTDRLTDAEMAAIRNVARQHAGSEFNQDPIAIELVESLLRLRLRRNQTDEWWKAISGQIAEVLCETPATAVRMQSLWNQLRRSGS